jgi:hypothetical protein
VKPLLFSCALMVFSYYNRLSSGQKLIYRKSDGIHTVPLPNSDDLQQFMPELKASLQDEDRVHVQLLCSMLAAGIAAGLQAPPLRVRVLAARPSASWGELHGLYVPARGRASALITVWMRTAKRGHVVAFRSFLRTLLHEICHHLDYEVFMLEESFHTAGFYKRESSLFHQLIRDST